ncbi:MAG: protein O-mannosyl-transferase family [Anaerolineae bacterium]
MEAASSGPLRGGSIRASLAGAAVVALAAVLYLLTLDDGLELRELAGGDLITHQYAQVQGRPSNAPGYPLYTMGGWVWFRVGRFLLGRWLNPTAVLSLYSTLWALAALAMLYVLALALTRGRWPWAVLATAFYAVTYFFWYYAVTTEQYASAVFHTLLILWLAHRWQVERRDRLLVGLAFVCGLALAHMVTVLLVVPALAWFVWREEPGLLQRGKLLVGLAAVALLPLVSYVYVYARGAAHPEWWGEGTWPDAWHWFWAFVSTRQGREELTWTLGPFTGEFPWLIVREMTWPGLLAGLGGIALLGRRWRGLLLGALAASFAFCYVDRYGNWYQVWMPMYAVLALGMAALATRLEVWGEGRWPGMWQAAALRWMLAGGFLLLAADRLVTSWPAADQRGRPQDDGLWPGLAILEDGPAPGAAVLGRQEEFLSLQYVTQIWGRRPDVRAVSAEDAKALLESGERPLYATAGALPIVFQEVSADVRLDSAGLVLVRVHRAQHVAEDEPPSTARFLHQVVGGGLELWAYVVEPGCRLPEATRRWLGVPLDGREGTAHLTLWWRAHEVPSADYSVSVRATRGGALLRVGEGLVQVDRAAPVWGAYSTGRWGPGEVVRDEYLLDWAEAWPYDGLAVVLYRREGAGFVNLGEVVVRLGPDDWRCW